MVKNVLNTDFPSVILINSYPTIVTSVACQMFKISWFVYLQSTYMSKYSTGLAKCYEFCEPTEMSPFKSVILSHLFLYFVRATFVMRDTAEVMCASIVIKHI